MMRKKRHIPSPSRVIATANPSPGPMLPGLAQWTLCSKETLFHVTSMALIAAAEAPRKLREEQSSG